MSTKPKTDETIPAELQDAANASYVQADSIAAMRLGHLETLQKARSAQASRIAARIGATCGVNSDAAKAAKTLAGWATKAAAQVAILRQQVSTPMPKVSASGWALHGRIFDVDFKPAASRTVFLVDGKQAYRSDYGFAYTDASGYFLLNIADIGESESAADIFVEVANAKGKPVLLSSQSLTPMRGKATYQNIALPAGEKPIGDPPAAIRRSALPKVKTKKRER